MVGQSLTMNLSQWLPQLDGKVMDSAVLLAPTFVFAIKQRGRAKLNSGDSRSFFVEKCGF